MARNRTIYQTEALYVGPSPSTGLHFVSTGTNPPGYVANIRPLTRVQSANYGYSLTRRDVNQYAELAAIDRVALESPTINLDFSYLNSHFANELYLGFYVNTGSRAASNGDSSCITNILNKTADDKNYFIKTVAEGTDAHTYALSGALVNFIGIGNGFISNFSTEAAVGDFPRTSITVEGLNILFAQAFSGAQGGDSLFSAGLTGVPKGTGCWIDIPAVNPSDGTRIAGASGAYAYIPISQSNNNFLGALSNPGYQDTIMGVAGITALRPGDVTVTFYDGGVVSNNISAGALISDAKIQSYNLNFSLSRDPLQKLGSKYAFAREIRFPVQINLSVEANIGDLATGNLVDVINADKTYDVQIAIKHPTSGTALPPVMAYTLKGAKLDSQSFTSSIGPNKAVSLNFSSQIGGPLQTTRGLFFSGHMSGIAP